MTATDAAQCVAFDGLVQPDQIPGATTADNSGGQLNGPAVSDACVQARSIATSLRTGVTDISSTWNAVPAVFQMPGADPVYSAMSSPSASLNTFATKLDQMAGALEDFAGEIEPLRRKFDDVRTRAQTFVDSLEPGRKVWMSARSTTEYQWDTNASAHTVYPSRYSYSYGGRGGYSSGGYGGYNSYGAGEDTAQSEWYSVYDAASYLRGRGESARVAGGHVEILVSWLESGEHVGRNNDFMDEIAELYAQLHGVEAECANRINGLREDACVAPVESVEAWQLKQDGVELPWGARVEEQRNCGEQVGHGFYEFGVGTVEGLGSLISYNPMKGEWGDWDHAGQSWAGIGDVVVSLVVFTSPPLLGTLHATGHGDWVAERGETLTEVGKSMIAWDTWEDAPAQAATETILNIGTAFIPVGGAVFAGLKGMSKAAGATRITGMLNTLDNIVPATMNRLRGNTPRLDIDIDVDIDTPRIDTDATAPRVDTDGPRVDTDASAPRANTDSPGTPGGGSAVDDAVRANNDTDTPETRSKHTDTDGNPAEGPTRSDDGARASGGGAADDAVHAGDNTDMPDGANTADDAVRAGDDGDSVGADGPNDGASAPQTPPPDRPSDAAIRDFAESRGLSNEQLHDLRRTPVDDLSDADITLLKELRDQIPAPTPDTIMVKVMPLDVVQKYLSGDYQGVQGFVARASDIDPQAGLAPIVDDLRLDYAPGEGRTNPYTDPSADGYAYIEFTTPDAGKIDTPYSHKFGGDADHGAPFTGNGFVGNADNTWRPEYQVGAADGARLNDGAKLWQVGPNGPQLVAIFRKGAWSELYGTSS